MRKLRIDGNAAMDMDDADTYAAERKLRFQTPPEIRSKADRLLALKTVLAAKKREAKSLEAEVSALQAELLAYGRENQLEILSTDRALVEFTARTQRTIEPEAFLRFLKGCGRTKEFYNFVDVPIGRATGHFGSAVLEASGVLRVSTTDYAGVRVRERT